MVSKISSLLFGALLILASVQQSPAQDRTPSDAANPNKPTESQLLKGILEEVRELRTTLQQNSLLQYRSAVMLDRVRRQEERVRTAEGELHQLRASVRELTDPARYDEVVEDIDEVDLQITEAVDLVDRGQLGRESKRLKNRLERQKKNDTDELERKRKQEPKLEEQLRTEQKALIELDYQLEALVTEAQRLVGIFQTSALKPAP
jgi:hypothetical protein